MIDNMHSTVPPLRVRRKSLINLRANLRRLSIATGVTTLLPPLPASPVSPDFPNELIMSTPTSSTFPSSSTVTATGITSIEGLKGLVSPLFTLLPRVLNNELRFCKDEQIQKRVTTFHYLKEAHEGKVFWFNTVLLTRDDLNVAFEHNKMKIRTTRFTILGMSLSSLLDITTPHDFLRTLSNLLSEFDAVPDDKFDRKSSKGSAAFFRNVAGGGNGRGRKSGGGGGDLSSGFGDSNDTCLFTPNIPFELDYFQVLFTTCDLLAQVYHQINLFIDPTGNHSSPNASSVNLGIPSNSHSLLSNGGNGFSPSLIELVLKIDTRIKKIIATITKDVDLVARNSIKDELCHLLGGGEDDFSFES